MAAKWDEESAKYLVIRKEFLLVDWMAIAAVDAKEVATELLMVG